MGRRRSPGALEAAVLRVLWDAEGPLSAREIRERIGPGADGVRADGVHDDGEGDDGEGAGGEGAGGEGAGGEGAGGEGQDAAGTGALALTTVLTVLDRLRGKQLVTKKSTPGGQVFAAASSESGFTADAMVSALLAATDRDAALLRFARRLDGRDLTVLRRALDGPTADGSGEAG